MKKQRIINVLIVLALLYQAHAIRKVNLRVDETQTVVMEVIVVVKAIVQFLGGGK